MPSLLSMVNAVSHGINWVREKITGKQAAASQPNRQQRRSAERKAQKAIVHQQKAEKNSPPPKTLSMQMTNVFSKLATSLQSLWRDTPPVAKGLLLENVIPAPVLQTLFFLQLSNAAIASICDTASPDAQSYTQSYALAPNANGTHSHVEVAAQYTPFIPNAPTPEAWNTSLPLAWSNFTQAIDATPLRNNDGIIFTPVVYLKTTDDLFNIVLCGRDGKPLSPEIQRAFNQTFFPLIQSLQPGPWTPNILELVAAGVGGVIGVAIIISGLIAIWRRCNYALPNENIRLNPQANSDYGATDENIRLNPQANSDYGATGNSSAELQAVVVDKPVEKIPWQRLTEAGITLENDKTLPTHLAKFQTEFDRFTCGITLEIIRGKVASVAISRKDLTTRTTFSTVSHYEQDQLVTWLKKSLGVTDVNQLSSTKKFIDPKSNLEVSVENILWNSQDFSRLVDQIIVAHQAHLAAQQIATSTASSASQAALVTATSPILGNARAQSTLADPNATQAATAPAP